MATFSQLTDELNKRKLGYIHVVDSPKNAQRISPVLRELFDGTYIVAEGFDLTSASETLARGEADLVAFGKPFISNPDLPERYRNNAAVTAWDSATFYQGGAKGDAQGYTDYPALA